MSEDGYLPAGYFLEQLSDYQIPNDALVLVSCKGQELAPTAASKGEVTREGEGYRYPVTSTFLLMTIDPAAKKPLTLGKLRVAFQAAVQAHEAAGNEDLWYGHLYFGIDSNEDEHDQMIDAMEMRRNSEGRIEIIFYPISTLQNYEIQNDIRERQLHVFACRAEEQ